MLTQIINSNDLGISVLRNKIRNILDKDITNEESGIQNVWLKSCGNLLEDLTTVGDAVERGKDETLYKVKSIWPNLKLDATAQWEYDFYKWAREYLISKEGRPLANPTIDNHIRVYETLMSDSRVVELPAHVEIPHIDEDGVITTMKIVPNIEDAQYSRLLAITKLAKQGDVGQEAWNLVFNPAITANEFNTKIKEFDSDDRWQKPKPPSDYNFFMKENFICFSTGERTLRLAELFELDEEIDPILWGQGVELMLAPIGVNSPIGRIKIGA